MSEVIKGFNIELGLDTLGVDAGLKDLNRQMSRVNSEFNRSLSNFSRGDRSLGRLDTTVQGLTSKMEVQEAIVDKNRRSYEGLSKEYDANRKALSDQGRAVEMAEKHMDDLLNSTNATVEEFAKAEVELRDAENAYADLNAEVDRNRVALDNSEVALNNSERQLNNLENSLSRTTQQYKEMLIEQEIANSNWTKAGGFVTSFSEKLETVSGVAQRVGDDLTKRITLPALGVATAAGGIVAAFGWKRLVGIDNARAQLQGMGYDAEEVERISEQVTNAVQGGMMTMAEGTATAAGALAVGVQEGKELEKYIKLVDAASVGMNRSVSETAMIFNRVQGGGRLMTQELNMVEEAMPGFSAAMAEHAGVTLEEFRKMVTEGEISSQDFMTVMEEFAGGMAEAYAGTWDGMVSNTKANIGILGQSLLEGVFQESKMSIEEFLDLLRSDVARNWAKETGAVLVDTFRNVRDMVGDAVEWWQELDDHQQQAFISAGIFAVGIGPVLSVLGRFGGAVATVGKGLGGLMTALGLKSGAAKGMQIFQNAMGGADKAIGSGSTGFVGKLGSIGDVAATVTGAGGLGKLTGALSGFGGPVGIAAGAITITLIGAFTKLYTESEGVRWAVSETGSLISESFQSAAENTVNSFEYIINDAFHPFNQALWDMEEPMLNFTDTIGVVNEVAKTSFSSMWDGIGEFFDNFYQENVSAGETVEVFGDKISEETVAMLEDYNTFSEGATEALIRLKSDGKNVTEEQIEELKTDYQTMHDEALLKLQERRESELLETQERLAGIKTLNDLDKEDILTTQENHYNTEEQMLTEKNQRILDLINSEFERNGEITDEGYKAIQQLQEDHNVKTTTNLSENEIEQQVIMENMRNNKTAISEEMITELIGDSEELKTRTVDEAKKQRDDTIAWAIDLHENQGAISEEKMNDIINGAQIEYDETVRLAENSHDDVIAWAKSQAKEHGIIVDGETGEILGKWEILRNELDTVLNDIVASMLQKGYDSGNGFTRGILSGLNWLATQFNKIPEKLGSDFRLPTITTEREKSTQYRGPHGGNQAISAYSTGTNYHMGGAARVGDVGAGNGIGRPSSTREIVELPSGKEYLVDGDVIFPDFPVGAKVRSNRDTERELDRRGLGVGSGMLNMMPNVITGPSLSAQNKAAKAGVGFGSMVRNIYDYIDDPETLINQLISETSFSGMSSAVEVGTGMVNKLSSGMIDKVKELFESASSTGDGSHILGKAITAYFGRYPAGINFNNGVHFGLDTAHVFDPLLSPINGNVTRVWNDYGGGRSIEIKSGRDYWWFMHLLMPLVKAGQSVTAGQRIGTTGNSGNWTTGPHLHTQYMPGRPGNAFAKDPLPVLRGLKNQGSYERGGLISSHGYYEGAEGNKPEMVIPLTNRSRAVQLMFEALSYMGDSKSQNQNSGQGDASGIIDRLERQIKLLEENLSNSNKMVEVLLKINEKELSIGDDEIGRSNDRFNSRESNKRNKTTGRMSYG